MEGGKGRKESRRERGGKERQREGGRREGKREGREGGDMLPELEDAYTAILPRRPSAIPAPHLSIMRNGWKTRPP